MQDKSKQPGGLKNIRILGFSLPVYLLVLAVAAACMACGLVPKKLIPSFFILMIIGEGLYAIGKTVPVVRTYLGGSVVCILGGAVIKSTGIIPAETAETLNFFVNDSGFLIFLIAGLITGSLFNVDRGLLLRATVKLIPVAVLSLGCGVIFAGFMGIVLGYGFWDGVLYLGVPMTSGGMTAGTVPLSSIFSQTLGIPAADVLNRMAPATVLGNVLAIIYGSVLNKLGKTVFKNRPGITGYGMLVNDGRDIPQMAPIQVTIPSVCTGMVISFAFYQFGALLNHFISVIPTYGWMIIAVVLVKGTGIMPADLENAARAWGQFDIHSFTAAALTGIGFTLVDLNVIMKTMTAMYLLSTVLIVFVIMSAAAFFGRLVGFYPLESGIAAGLCCTNMGGTGNVAILSSAERMELLPFAQIVTRCCGALMLTVGGILVGIVG